MTGASRRTPSRAAIAVRLDGRRGPLDAAALFAGGRLEDLLLRPRDADAPEPGEIYAARLTRRLPGAGAAFVDLGGATAFLSDAGDLPEGAGLLIEILRPPLDRKAAEATRKLTFAGRLLAHTPSAPGVNLSKKIADPERRAALSAALAPFADQGGWVVRTAAAEAADARIAAEAEALAAEAAALSGAPATPPRRLRPAPDLAALAARRWALEIADRRAEGPDGADALALAEALDALLAPELPLPGGGRLSFGRLEALVAIDVDASDGSTQAANAAAARAIPRQLRLRGWGGMVVIDFAGGPRREADRTRLTDALRAASGADPIRIAGWGPLGLLELTRRRDRTPLEDLWSPA